MEIKSARFVKSSPSVNICPESKIPEYAFIGRSNVGKSSLINMLTNQSKLAMTSSKPGKTQLINHFMINENWYLVDLPGYGFAKISKKKHEKFLPMISEYIRKREQLVMLFVLIDSRLEPQAIDLQFINKLGEYQVPFALIFTKIDKLGKQVLKTKIENYKTILKESWEELPPVFMSSIEDKRGRDEILDYIGEINLELRSRI